MSYGYRIWSKLSLVQTKDDDDLHGCYEPPQRVTNLQVLNLYQTCYHVTQSKILSSVDSLIAHFIDINYS